MITHIIESYWIPSQMKAEKLEKIAKNWNSWILEFCYTLNTRHSLQWLWLFVANMEIIDLELKTLQSGHDFQSQ